MTVHNNKSVTAQFNSEEKATVAKQPTHLYETFSSDTSRRRKVGNAFRRSLEANGAGLIATREVVGQPLKAKRQVKEQEFDFKKFLGREAASESIFNIFTIPEAIPLKSIEKEAEFQRLLASPDEMAQEPEFAAKQNKQEKKVDGAVSSFFSQNLTHG